MAYITKEGKCKNLTFFIDNNDDVFAIEDYIDRFLEYSIEHWISLFKLQDVHITFALSFSNSSTHPVEFFGGYALIHMKPHMDNLKHSLHLIEDALRVIK